MKVCVAMFLFRGLHYGFAFPQEKRILNIFRPTFQIKNKSSESLFFFRGDVFKIRSIWVNAAPFEPCFKCNVSAFPTSVVHGNIILRGDRPLTLERGRGIKNSYKIQWNGISNRIAYMRWKFEEYRYSKGVVDIPPRASRVPWQMFHVSQFSIRIFLWIHS